MIQLRTTACMITCNRWA